MDANLRRFSQNQHVGIKIVKGSRSSCRAVAHAELRNWSRWCWTGAWPHPLPYGLDPAQLREDEPTEAPPNADRALRVERIYQTLPLAEQRVLQAEYPRRHEYAVDSRKQLMRLASTAIGISEAYYAMALERAMTAIAKEFRW